MRLPMPRQRGLVIMALFSRPIPFWPLRVTSLEVVPGCSVPGTRTMQGKKTPCWELGAPTLRRRKECGSVSTRS
jgi:hypothetical protein